MDASPRAHFTTDICVIGGGPAGATIARKLAQLGHQVCLIEKDTFPRPHIGESLTPGILPVLDALGLRQTVEQAGFLRANQAIIHWSSRAERHKTGEGEPGFQVDRGKFDAILLDAAREAGVRVLQPATVRAPSQPINGEWTLDVLPAGQEQAQVVKTRFLVDASGKHGLLPGKRQRTSASTLALYGYWHNVKFNSPETRVEAGANAWYWGAPLPDGTINACVFIDPKEGKAGSPEERHQTYQQLLAKSTLLQHCLSGELRSPVRVCNAGSYYHDDPVGDQFIRVGDAALSIDPLSSQGVQTAMLGALQASIVVHTCLTLPNNRILAQQFYRDRQIETVSRNAHWAARFYAEQDRFPDASFWRQRARPWLVKAASLDEQETLLIPAELKESTRVQICKQATVIPTPVIQGHVIVEQPALSHPLLERPVAYLGNQAILPLLASITRGDSAQSLLQKWGKVQPRARAAEWLHWLWVNRILVTYESSAAR